MALTRAKKTLKVEQLAQELQGSTSAIVGTFTKLTVSQDFDLRRKVRDAGGRYRVVKNKLASRASEGTGIAQALQGLKGVSSVAYTSGDPVALAKALSTWVKENAEFTFKLGIVDGKVITIEEIQSLATMPSKEEIFAKLLFLMNAPAQRLATVMAATGRDLAVVLNQGVEKEKFAAGEVAPVVAPASIEAASVPAAAESASQEAASEVSSMSQAPVIELAGSEPVQSEPAQSESVLGEPARSESVLSEPVQVEPVASVSAETSEVAQVPASPEQGIESQAEGSQTEGSQTEGSQIDESQAEAASNEAPVEGA